MCCLTTMDLHFCPSSIRYRVGHQRWHTHTHVQISHPPTSIIPASWHQDALPLSLRLLDAGNLETIVHVCSTKWKSKTRQKRIQRASFSVLTAEITDIQVQVGAQIHRTHRIYTKTQKDVQLYVSPHIYQHTSEVCIWVGAFVGPLSILLMLDCYPCILLNTYRLLVLCRQQMDILTSGILVYIPLDSEQHWMGTYNMADIIWPCSRLFADFCSIFPNILAFRASTLALPVFFPWGWSPWAFF